MLVAILLVVPAVSRPVLEARLRIRLAMILAWTATAALACITLAVASDSLLLRAIGAGLCGFWALAISLLALGSTARASRHTPSKKIAIG